MSATTVSVVVPTRDRPAKLANCLRALGEVDHPRDRLEVIVVDDGGGSDLAPVCAAAPEGLSVRLIRQEGRGPAAARNAGVDAAKGDLLAFTDDDCLPEPGWLRELTAGLAQAPGAGCGGRVVNALSANMFAEASQHILELVYAHYNADPEAARFFASNNIAVPRDAYVEIGGFDERFPGASEDRDFCDRWLASGRTLRYAPAAVVRHAHDLDLSGFVRQHVGYGRGAALYQRGRAARGRGRMRDDLGFHVNRSLWGRTLGLRPRRRAVAMAGLLGIWQVANTAGYALERAAALKRTGDRTD